MKIAQLSSHYRPVIGGQEVYIKNLNSIITEAGHETLVYQLQRGESANDNVCIPKIPYLSKFIVEFETRWLTWVIDMYKPKALFNADLIIGHYASVSRSLESVSTKAIILSHGVEWRTENQRDYDRYREENAKWCLDKYPHVVNDTYYLRYLGIDVEPGEKNYFTEVSPGKWFIPNCIDTALFTRVKRKPEYENKKMILVPRQMVEDRGIHLAIEAFAIIADKYPEFEMCLLGKRWGKKNPYITRLDNLISKHNLQERVYFRDPVQNNMMPEWYSSAELTVIPTLRREGTSLSAIESMSCGVVTVTTNVVGLADLPTYQCDPTSMSLAEAMAYAIDNQTTLAESQCIKTRQQLNLENWADAWLKVIDSVSRQ